MQGWVSSRALNRPQCNFQGQKKNYWSKLQKRSQTIISSKNISFFIIFVSSVLQKLVFFTIIPECYFLSFTIYEEFSHKQNRILPLQFTKACWFWKKIKDVENTENKNWSAHLKAYGSNIDLQKPQNTRRWPCSSIFKSSRRNKCRNYYWEKKTWAFENWNFNSHSRNLVPLWLPNEEHMVD